MIKNWVEFSMVSFGTLKYDYVIKIMEIFNFLRLINNSGTIEYSFLLLIIPAIKSSKTVLFYVFYLNCISQYFCKHLAYHLITQ